MFWVPERRSEIAFTCRSGGRSSGPFRSLNLGEHTEDSIENIRDNRRTVSEALGISSRWIMARQVHGSRAIRSFEGSEGSSEIPEADAIVAGRGGPPLAVATADCLPIALTGGSVRGVVHAGWRGLSAGVIDEAIILARAAGTRLEAFIGPSIGPCHFQVGPEVADTFRNRYPDAPDFEKRGKGSRSFDLRAAARWILRQWGIDVDDQDPPCTFCDSRFFSHRRDGLTGRQAAIVW